MRHTAMKFINHMFLLSILDMAYDLHAIGILTGGIVITKRHMTALAGVFSLAALCAPQAQAEWIQLDHVTGEVTQVGGSYQYAFGVYNDSYWNGNGDEDWSAAPFIIDFELPYYADMGITNITSPWGWDYEIAKIGVANPDTGWTGVAAWMTDPDWSNSPFAGVTEVIHWYGYCVWGGEWCTGMSAITPGNYLAPGEIVDGGSPFGFTASYGATDAPYQTSWLYAPLNVGDPPMPMMPASPCALGQCGGGSSNVPEPGSLALASAALLAAVGIRRRNKLAS
jgi:hypothetical protein